jgi:DNA ligase 1
MRLFAALFDRLDRTTSLTDKGEAIAAYLAQARPEDAAWALYFLTGRKLKRLVNVRQLWDWSMSRTGLADWLLGECYSVVGDMAETITLLVDPREGRSSDLPLAEWIEGRLMRLPMLEAAAQREAVLEWWDQVSGTELFLLNKMITGEMRIGVSQGMVIKAVARFAGVEEGTIAHRLAGEWRPTPRWFAALTAPGGESDAQAAAARPYPFFLASPLLDLAPDATPEPLGPREEWLVEYKWDGIRAQLLKRNGNVWLWSRGDELITDRFPEIRDAAARLPDGTAIDGEIMAYREGPLKFSILQRRIGRQALTPAILREAPAALVAYDLIEEGGEDIRSHPLIDRRERLEKMLNRHPSPRLVLSPEVGEPTWEALAEVRRRSRERNVEGLMLKRRTSAYQVGRRRGDWWKWKIDPYSIDAVLVYAQPGHGRRANLLTDYTFAVWDRPGSDTGVFAELDRKRESELVPIAKAYSGLSDEEIASLDRWIRQHTIERFGPVRAVEPELVFELHFEGLAESTRHRSGIAVRFPRIARQRADKPAAEADTLDRVRELLNAQKGRDNA